MFHLTQAGLHFGVRNLAVELGRRTRAGAGPPLLRFPNPEMIFRASSENFSPPSSSGARASGGLLHAVAKFQPHLANLLQALTRAFAQLAHILAQRRDFIEQYFLNDFQDEGTEFSFSH
jgi:hypothetical protein